ncbi:MAG: hypothetical protein A2144_12135 [Chloroflexi bacterium RBG_16_50_9]|nr:MAG: hypothetical protein A2144_12135 [Chloroflexi bacterium RBG_16_50_9]
MSARKPNENQDRPTSNMLTTGEVARIFQVSTSTVSRWSKQGILKAQVSPRGARRFRREDVAVLYLDKAIQKYLKGKAK